MSLIIRPILAIFGILNGLATLPVSLIRGILSIFRGVVSSPWGLLIPMTAIAVFFLSRFLENSPDYLAREVFQIMVDAEDADVSQHAVKLGKMGRFGIPYLVQGLESSRESVVLASRDVLQGELQQYSKLDLEDADSAYLVLSGAIAERLEKFGPSAKLIVASFAERMLREVINSGSLPNRGEIVLNCERICASTKSERLIDRNPRILDSLYRDVLGGEPVKSRCVDSEVDSMQPFAFRKGLRGNYSDDIYDLQPHLFDRFGAERADILYALHNSPDYGNTRSPGPELPQGMMLAETNAGLDAYNEGPAVLPVESGAKYGGNYENRTPARANAEEAALHAYLEEQELARIAGGKVPLENTPLGTSSLERYVHLNSNDLIRLLHHIDPRCSNKAREMLQGRDGFRDSHIELAFRLYHPNPEIRRELVSILPNYGDLNPFPWLMVLIEDEDADVRYSAAASMATANDVNLIRAVSERARLDSDPRIREISRKLDGR